MESRRKTVRCAVVAYHNLLHEGGYRVRVLNSLRLIAERAAARGMSLRFDLVGFEGLRPFFSLRLRRQLREALGNAPVRTWVFPTLPERHPLLLVANLFLAGAVLALLGLALRWRIVHAHASLAAFAGIVGRKAGRYGLFFDVHGADVEEREMLGILRPGTLPWRLYAWMERIACYRADVAFCVSEPLRRRLGPNVLSCIVPCCVDEPPGIEEISRRREIARRELDLNGRTVIGYLGGTSVWQHPEDMVAVFADISRTLPDAVFLILSPDQREFLALLSKHAVAPERYRLLAVPHAQVQALSPAMDVGMLLRADTTVNRVASPTKFAEYLAGGVPVLLTEALSDFAAMVRREKVGVIWRQPQPTAAETAELARFLRELQPRRSELARRCRDLVASELNWRTGGDAYWQFYEEYLLAAGSCAFRGPQARV